MRAEFSNRQRNNGREPPLCDEAMLRFGDTGACHPPGSEDFALPWTQLFDSLGHGTGDQG
jgi:hypothetical protein